MPAGSQESGHVEQALRGDSSHGSNFGIANLIRGKIRAKEGGGSRHLSGSFLSIVLPLIPFYVAFVFSYEIESVFVGIGKTQYPLLVSCVVNFVYYGIMAWLFAKGWFSASMEFIEHLFGFGMAFGLAAYVFLLFLGRTKPERMRSKLFGYARRQ